MEVEVKECPYWLTIRRNADGVERTQAEPFGDWHNPQPDDPDWTDEFVWSEGNYACDCNRQLFWNRAAGEPDEDLDQCSDELYSVKLTDKYGFVLYSDYETSR